MFLLQARLYPGEVADLLVECFERQSGLGVIKTFGGNQQRSHQIFRLGDFAQCQGQIIHIHFWNRYIVRRIGGRAMIVFGAIELLLHNTAA